MPSGAIRRTHDGWCNPSFPHRRGERCTPTGRVRDLAAAGDIEVVLVHSPDRLSRAYAYQVLLIEELGRHGVETVETRFRNAPSSATAEDHLLVQIQGMVAEYGPAQILDRSRRGRRHRARAGEIIVMGGAPYDHRCLRKRDDAAASYVVVEAEARVVCDIDERYCVKGLEWASRGPAGGSTSKAWPLARPGPAGGPRR